MSISIHLHVQFIRWIFMIISCFMKSSCHFCVGFVFVLLCIVISYDYMSNITGFLSEAETVYPSKATGSNAVLLRGVHVTHHCSYLSLFSLSSSCVLNVQCCQCCPFLIAPYRYNIKYLHTLFPLINLGF